MNRGVQLENSSKKVIVSFKDIFVRFDGEVILNHINLDIREKEFVTILGSSGCGKTTTLRIIGGFIQPEGGIYKCSQRRLFIYAGAVCKNPVRLIAIWNNPSI